MKAHRLAIVFITLFSTLCEASIEYCEYGSERSEVWEADWSASGLTIRLRDDKRDVGLIFKTYERAVSTHNGLNSNKLKEKFNPIFKLYDDGEGNQNFRVTIEDIPNYLENRPLAYLFSKEEGAFKEYKPNFSDKNRWIGKPIRTLDKTSLNISLTHNDETLYSHTFSLVSTKDIHLGIDRKTFFSTNGRGKNDSDAKFKLILVTDKENYVARSIPVASMKEAGWPAYLQYMRERQRAAAGKCKRY